MRASCPRCIYKLNTRQLTDILDNRRTQTRIQVPIPQDLHEEPVISRLVSQYGVIVIIADAQVSANVPQYSCFDLEMRGTVSQIESALIHLDEVDLEAFHQSSPEEALKKIGGKS